ncbi:peptidoglycan recognition protein family protein, partial [Streptomyces vinaceus]|uniref:peptidoglycan recognition protein family protein n=1 Tax=Streptomyces vinaceus TaxID=1960 RepID=UPI003692BB54
DQDQSVSVHAPLPGEQIDREPGHQAADEPEGDDKGDVVALPGMTMEMAESSSANVPLAGLGAKEITALNKADTTADAVAADGSLTAAARPYIGPRPRIVTRLGWGADESLRESGFVYTGTVKAAFVHHSASGNNYACKDAPAVLRSLYRYHVVSSGWRDLGYNFAVDKCGTVYEGRAGGVAKAVLGAHTMGFNTDSMGVAVLGTYTSTKPPAAAVKAVAQLTAWKLGLFNRDPRATTTLKSGGGNRFKKGTNVKLNVISGHRDGFATECPGKLLYAQLPPTRTTSAKLQGRP